MFNDLLILRYELLLNTGRLPSPFYHHSPSTLLCRRLLFPSLLLRYRPRNISPKPMASNNNTIPMLVHINASLHPNQSHEESHIVSTTTTPSNQTSSTLFPWTLSYYCLSSYLVYSSSVWSYQAQVQPNNLSSSGLLQHTIKFM